MDQRVEKNRIFFLPDAQESSSALRWQMPKVRDGASPRRHALCPATRHGQQPDVSCDDGSGHGCDHGSGNDDAVTRAI
jgi:hypothetical protein